MDLIERDAALALIDCCLGNSLGGRKEFDSGLMQARKFVLRTPAVDRWISVEDALPEKDKSYITYAETTKYCNHNEISEDSRINVLYFDGDEWYDGECRYYNVLYWMPLPESPKKEVSDEKK